MTIILLPLFGFLLSFFAGYIGKRSASFLNISSVALAFLFAISLAKKVCLDGITHLYQFDWMSISTVNLKFTLLFDPLSMIMTLLITFITLLVMIYSYGYLNDDPSLVKFLSYLSFFAFTMLTLVTAGNYVQLFLGWEGVGVASYLLISFWNTRNEATKGGLKAIVVNRIGDVFFIFALGLMWTLFKSFDFGLIFNIVPFIIDEEIKVSLLGYTISLVSLLAFCLFVAACAKSAQLLLHTWLPDAMEGPTPVSSLLHSATMVTAGVFIIIRSSFIFSLTPNLSVIMACLGVLTALVSGLIGMTQSDLKKIIAYSTCSQLGFMVTACGLGYYNYALFHLITHAFFKCLLFLCSGSVIHAVGDEQDIRKMGALYHYLPVTFGCMIIGNLALCGFPFLAGFYSKDFLLETSYATGKLGITIFFVLSFCAFLTSFYSFRSLFLTFFYDAHFDKSKRPHISEAPFTMLFPMIVLTLMSLCSGFILSGLITGPGGLIFLRNSVATSLNSSLFEFEPNIGYLKLFPTFASLIGIICSFYATQTDFFKFKLYLYDLFNLFAQKFFIDKIYNRFLGSKLLDLSLRLYKDLDRGWLEVSTWLSKLVNFIGEKLTKLTTGYLVHYVILLSIAIIWFILMEIFGVNAITLFLFSIILL